MEPRLEAQKQTPETPAEGKPRRFRIVKLEERIAPSRGLGTGGTNKCTNGGYTCVCANVTDGGVSCRMYCTVGC